MIDLTHETLRLFALPVHGFTNSRLEGVFSMPSRKDGRQLRIIASATGGWDHVSVSRFDRCPNWYELEQVKRLFFLPSETAMQLHVPPAEHINNNENCLHLWRPQLTEIPRPPSAMVGVIGMSQEEVRALGAGVF